MTWRAEAPVVQLAKQMDLTAREHRRGNKIVFIRPGADGAATVFDNDLLRYVASQKADFGRFGTRGKTAK